MVALIGCAKKADEVELKNAETLTEGLTTMRANVNGESGLAGSSHKPLPMAPPWPWLGPDQFTNIPEGSESLYYHFAIRWDSAGALIDSVQWLIMLTPDVWDSLIPDTNFVTLVDFWLWRQVASDVWWHFNLGMSPTDSVHITGSMKWHYLSTWLNYAYTVSTDTSISKAGTIDVTTSDDIKLSANFTFIDDGSGTGWGKFQNFKFVDWLFFALPDSNSYNGYYTLASEDWKVKHYFPEQ
jgi:hypothetical protein